jgi:hypothetical protein
MPNIAVKPLYLKDAAFSAKLDETTTNNYEAAISGVTFTPTSSAASWTGIGGNSFTEQATPTWVAGIDYVQDWESEDSFSNFLMDHAGETLPCTFTPKRGGRPVDANLSIVPGPIGGAGQAYATATVSLGSDTPIIGDAPGTLTVASDDTLAGDETTVA